MKILALLFAVSMAIHAAVRVEKVEYKGWPNCYRVSNGEVELVVTSDVGPRVIRFGFVGGQFVLRIRGKKCSGVLNINYVQWFLTNGHRGCSL